jgi:single-strand DNA-binding protein
MHFNTVLLSGNLGADPEMKFTASGTAVTNMRLATNRRYTDAQGNPQERTDWHRIVVFGKQAQACAEHLKKGRLVGVEGELRSRSYEDKDGNTRYVVEVVARSVKFGPKPNDGSSSGPALSEGPPAEAYSGDPEAS